MLKTNLVVGCGFSGATIARKIAEELNVCRSTIYNYMKNNHKLLREA